MIRPRIGNFIYTEDEITMMEEEIEIFSLKKEGIAGLVFGCLTLARTIDFPSMTR